LSILLFALIFPLLNLYQGEGWLIRALSGSLIKIFLTLPLAGISYEISRQAGKPKSCGFWRILIFPGLLIQRLTTRETDDQKLEVAMRALSEALDIAPQNAYLDPLTVSAFKDKACSTTTYN
jgi:uncharacterized protein YqhQ